MPWSKLFFSKISMTKESSLVHSVKFPASVGTSYVFHFCQYSSALRQLFQDSHDFSFFWIRTVSADPVSLRRTFRPAVAHRRNVQSRYAKLIRETMSTAYVVIFVTRNSTAYLSNITDVAIKWALWLMFVAPLWACFQLLASEHMEKRTRVRSNGCSLTLSPGLR